MNIPQQKAGVPKKFIILLCLVLFAACFVIVWDYLGPFKKESNEKKSNAMYELCDLSSSTSDSDSTSQNWPPSEGFFIVSSDKGLLVLSAKTGKVLRVLPYRPIGLDHLKKVGGTQEISIAYPEGTFSSEKGNLLVQSSSLTGNKGIEHITYIWDLAAAKLLWSRLNTEAIAFLGEKEDRIAVLTRPPGSKQIEFAIWEIANNRKVFSKMLVVDDVAKAYPLGSKRFAVFVLDHRFLWIWDQKQQALQLVPTSPKEEIGKYQIRAFKLSPDAQDLIFASGSKLWHMNLEQRTEPKIFSKRSGEIIGWSQHGRYVLLKQNHLDPKYSNLNPMVFHQLDGTTGTVLQSWEHHPIRVEPFSGHVPSLDTHPILTNDGRYLSFWDDSRRKLVVWDVTASPPQQLTNIQNSCKRGNCQDRASGRVLFPIGTTQYIHVVERELGRIDVDSITSENPRICMLPHPTQNDVNDAVKLTDTQSLDFTLCYLDLYACFKTSEQNLKQNDEYQALRLLRQACVVNGDPSSCSKLVELAEYSRPAEAYLAKAVSCSKQLTTTKKDHSSQGAMCPAWEPELLLQSFDQEEWLLKCQTNTEYCWAGSELLSHNPHSLYTALEIAKIGCDAGDRRACMNGATIASEMHQGENEYKLYTQACFINEAEDCLEGQRLASEKFVQPAWMNPDAERPQIDNKEWCDHLSIYSKTNIVGTRHFFNGRYAGILLKRVWSDIDILPFQEGDILFDKGRCGQNGCKSEKFLGSVVTGICRHNKTELIHNIRLEVGSPNVERNSNLLLARKL